MRNYKIMWLVASPTTEFNRIVKNVDDNGITWVESLLTLLSPTIAFDLIYVFPSAAAESITCQTIGSTRYYSFPCKTSALSYPPSLEKTFSELMQNIAPDLVHIWGTERVYALALLRSCPQFKYVVNIQGLTSKIAYHCNSGIPAGFFRYLTIKDIYNKNWFAAEKRKFEKRGLIEVEIIKRSQHVIGRTSWDFASTHQICKTINYYHCNEAMRSIFYDTQWKLAGCKRYTIFMSQAVGPLKGLHYALEALYMLRLTNKNVILRVAGPNLFKNNTLYDKLRLTGYAKYIHELIDRYNLGESIEFTGVLNEQQMYECYLSSHVYLSPSSIENSSNSLAEAMLLGLPCVVSCVGGAQDAVTDRVDAYLYPHDEPYMMAYYIQRFFDNDDIAEKFSNTARTKALEIHNRDKIAQKMKYIYNDLLSTPNVDLQD